MGATKNLGQVAGVHIGSTPPDNVILIWYDNTPSQQRHKVYDPTLKQWVVLDQTTISAITYSELVNMAKNTGLSVGEWFQITDRSNALALAITSTKVQYSDALGNILIDDLGTNIQYHVTSSNLSIDDVIGVFDEVNKKLVFQFNEVVPDMTADDYVLGKIQRNNVWSLAKYRLSSFLSKVTGNSISWNGGFFFNFTAAIKGILDKKGGVVAKDTYDSDMQTLNTSIQNVGKENQNIIKNAQDALDKAVAPDQFYATKSPALETGGEPTDAAKGDALLTILSKFQRYITRFKYATGIRVSTDFTDAVNPEYVNNNDTVDSALRKIQYWLKHAGTGSKLSPDWAPKNYAGSIVDVAGGDSLDEAFAKAIGKLNQIGDISNGRITSKRKNNNLPATDFNLSIGKLLFNYHQLSQSTYDNQVTISNDSGINVSDRNGHGATLNANGNRFNGDVTNIYKNGVYSAALFEGVSSSNWGTMAALQAYATGTGRNLFDAYFPRLKVGIMSLEEQTVNGSDITISSRASFIVGVDASAARNVYLPNNPADGTMVYVTKASNQNLNIYAQGTEKIDNIGSEIQSVTLTNRGHVFCFLYVSGIYYEAKTTGLWLYARWSH